MPIIINIFNKCIQTVMYYIFAVLSTVKPDVFEQKKKNHCGKSAICSYKLFDTVIRYM